jgi:peptidoglycan hydrolase-like protein with peptidoglycan-binding domain
MAEKEGLPGLYDPVSGYFVSSMMDRNGETGESRPRISATASKSDTEKLAKLGLVPQNARTSALGGLVGTGTLFGSSEENARAAQDVKNTSTKAVAAQTSAAAMAQVPELIKQAIAIINKLTAELAATQSGGASAQKKESVEVDIAKALVESFNIEYLKEDQADLDKLQGIMAKLADLDPDGKSPGYQELMQAYNKFMDMKDAPAKPAEPAPATPATPTAPAAPAAPAASAQKRNYGAGVLGPGSVGPEVEALQKKLGIEPDGKYGPKTKAAVEALQGKLGVTVDGLYGPITRAAHEKGGHAGASGQKTPAPTTAELVKTAADLNTAAKTGAGWDKAGGASNGGGAAFGNPNITRQGANARANQAVAADAAKEAPQVKLQAEIKDIQTKLAAAKASGNANDVRDYTTQLQGAQADLAKLGEGTELYRILKLTGL